MSTIETEMPPAIESAAEAGSEWATWGGWVPSALASHQDAGGDAECCRAARAWFLAMDRSLWRAGAAPGWIRRHYEWGPTCWPAHWCEVVEAKAICCGAHAALAVEAFRARGVEAVPVQLVQRYPAHDVRQWHQRWATSGANPAWAGDGVVYHEAVALLDGDQARVWNPTEPGWISPDAFRSEGSGGIVAIRLGGPAGGDGPDGRTVRWGDAGLPLGAWASPNGEA